MTSPGHKKHTQLTRPAIGNFNRNEWALLGAPCDTIRALSLHIIAALAGSYKCAYADAAHGNDDSPVSEKLSQDTFLEYTGYPDYARLNYSRPSNSFNLRYEFSVADMVLANGNHYTAKAQVIIINSSKIASLKKRMQQLTDVKLFILDKAEPGIFDFIKEAIPEWQNIPLFHINDLAQITAFFNDKMRLARPVLNGLVLAGGKSERMGFDKGAVQWYEKEQRYHMADLLDNICDEVFISCRPGQDALTDPGYKTITDTFTGLGPYGAILSAFRYKPDNAWLVAACDLPLADATTLKELVDKRTVSAVATAFKSPLNDLPEPLITIWEPKSYPVLLSFLAQGYSCPRKVLINSDTALINAKNPAALTNVNTPEDAEKAQQLIGQAINPRLPAV